MFTSSLSHSIKTDTCSYFGVICCYVDHFFHLHQSTLLSRDSLIVWRTERHTLTEHLHSTGAVCQLMEDDRKEFECGQLPIICWISTETDNRHTLLWRLSLGFLPVTSLNDEVITVSLFPRLPHIYLSWTNTELMWAGLWPGLSHPAGRCWSLLEKKTRFYASSTMTAFISTWWDICIKSTVVGIWQQHYCKRTHCSFSWMTAHTLCHSVTYSGTKAPNSDSFCE